MKEKILISILALAVVINTSVVVIISDLATPNGLIAISVIAASSAVAVNQLCKVIGGRRRRGIDG